MTIRIYPSRLPGEPLETHEHDRVTVHAWLAANVDNYRQDMAHPVAVEVDGISVPPALWPEVVIDPDSDVRMFPVPGVVVVGLIASVYSVYVMSTLSFGMGSSPGQGDSISYDPAKANSVRLGDPIREILGRCRVYPEYIVQSFSRFDKDDPRLYRTELFLSVGAGNLSINPSDIRIGNTPVTAFGDDVAYTIYPPGADVSGDYRTENWYACSEVGGTGSGTAGLDLASTAPDSASISADSIGFSGDAITVIGQTSSAGGEEDSAVPESWKAGTVLTVTAPDTFTVATEGGHSVIYGDMTELAPAVGMPVTLTWSNTDYDLFVSAVDPGTPAVPGVGGNAASVTASAAPSTYDFSESPLSFTLSWAGASRIISLTANYLTMAGLTEEISDQLTGTGLVATADDIRLRIGEASSPFSGNAIGYSLLPVVLFGSSPVVVAGVASSGGSPGVLPHISLAYTSATGTAFSGLPAGVQRLGLTRKGKKYRIVSVEGLSITVVRLIANADGSTSVDAGWPGFTNRVLLDGTVTGVNDDYDWMGPFMSCPDGETTSVIEMNFIYPQGLVDIGSKDGAMHWHEVRLQIQYRLAGTSAWTSVSLSHWGVTINEVGYTEAFPLPVAGNYEVRVRRETPVWGGTTRDSVQWQAMRARLPTRPARYRDITSIAMTVRTGNRLAAQSDRRVNVRPTRIYDGYPSRSISGAFHHVLTSAGMSADEIDTATISALESTYWTPRGERFDFSADGDNTSVLDMMQMIANAGMGYFLLSDGLASAGREGVKPWTGIISPQETTEHMKTSFTAPSQDDYDAVDVTYINGTSWAEETVQCRIGSDTPFKVEAYQLDGVTDPDKAYRIGMRRLMKYRLQRESYEVVTEMDARCYNVGDRLVLTDDIPGSNTISCLIEALAVSGGVVTLHVSEPLDWTFTSPRCLIRFQDGSASPLLTPERVDEYTLTLLETESLRLDEWITDNPAVELPRLIFCSSEQVGYDAIVSSVEPSSDGTTTANGVQYTPLLYQYDDAVYPGDSA